MGAGTEGVPVVAVDDTRPPPPTASTAAAEPADASAVPARRRRIDWGREEPRLRLADALLQHNGLATVVVDETWTVVFAAGAVEYVTGYSSASQLVGRSLLDFAYPDDLEIALEGIATAEQLEPDRDEVNIVGAPVAVRMIRADGNPATVTISAANLLHDPEVRGIALRVQLAESQALVDRFVELLTTGAAPIASLQPLLDALAITIPQSGVAAILRDDEEVVVVESGLGPEWCDVLRRTVDASGSVSAGLSDELGQTVVVRDELVSTELAELLQRSRAPALWVHTIASMHAPELVDGSLVVVRWTTEPMLFNHRQELARAARFTSLALHQRRQEQSLRRSAETDALTGLGNRGRFRQVVDELEAEGRPYAVLYLDLDGFKPINDDHGHDVGDAVLEAVADVLRGCARNDDLVVRLGGDEFGIVVADVDDRATMAPLEHRIAERLAHPLVVGDLTFRLRASTGVALSVEHGTASDVVRAADQAMYTAKRDGVGPA